MSVNLIVEEAQVSKGTFFHHFGDRASYLLAIHRDFPERILGDILDAIEGLDPGAHRLHVAASTYLDVAYVTAVCVRYCLKRALSHRLPRRLLSAIYM